MEIAIAALVGVVICAIITYTLKDQPFTVITYPYKEESGSKGGFG